MLRYSYEDLYQNNRYSDNIPKYNENSFEKSGEQGFEILKENY